MSMRPNHFKLLKSPFVAQVAKTTSKSGILIQKQLMRKFLMFIPSSLYNAHRMVFEVKPVTENYQYLWFDIQLVLVNFFEGKLTKKMTNKKKSKTLTDLLWTMPNNRATTESSCKGQLFGDRKSIQFSFAMVAFATVLFVHLVSVHFVCKQKRLSLMRIANTG